MDIDTILNERFGCTRDECEILRGEWSRAQMEAIIAAYQANITLPDGPEKDAAIDREIDRALHRASSQQATDILKDIAPDPILGQGWQFDGVGDYVDNSFWSDRFEGEFTWMAFVVIDEGHGSNPIIAANHDLGTADKRGWMVKHSSDRKIEFHLPVDNTSATAYKVIRAKQALQIGRAIHVAVTFGLGDEMKIYYEGYEQEVDVVSSATITDVYHYSDYRVGAGNNAGAVLDPFKGKLQDIRVYDLEKLDLEIQHLIHTAIDTHEPGVDSAGWRFHWVAYEDHRLHPTTVLDATEWVTQSAGTKHYADIEAFHVATPLFPIWGQNYEPSQLQPSLGGPLGYTPTDWEKQTTFSRRQNREGQ